MVNFLYHTASAMATSAAHLLDQSSTLSASLKQTNALIVRLSKLSFHTNESTDSSNSTRVELAQDIQDSLKQHDRDFELLQQDAEDLTGVRRREGGGEKERERARLAAQVGRLEEDLRRARSSFRRAQLIAKRASDAASLRERESFFLALTRDPQPVTEASSETGTTTPDLFQHRSKRTQKPKLSKEEIRLAAQSDVVAGLRRTYNQLSSEVTRSRFAQETLDESSAALARLGDQYEGLGSVVGKSRQLLGTLLRSQKSDTWYLETAFYILLATLAWLVFRRIFYGPFVKLPLFFYRLTLTLLNWIFLKPFWLLLTLTGIIRTEPIGQNFSAAPRISSSRPPLIVHPSATDRVHVMNADQQERMRQGKGIPAGAGGGNAKTGKDPVLQGKMSEEIGQMAENSGSAAESGEADGAKAGQESTMDDEEGIVRRGDGTILQDRGDVPKNPKKKVFEDEGRTEEAGAGTRRKRDEL
nr:hypothetical protein CFP56_50306 [Quercus suber]